MASNGYDLQTGSFGVDISGLANTALGFYTTSVNAKVKAGEIQAGLAQQSMKNNAWVYVTIAGLLFVLILKNR